MLINNSVSFGSGSADTAYNKLVSDSKADFRKLLQEKERKAKEDVLDLSFKVGETKQMSGLSRLQISYLKSKYDVTNMIDEQFDSLLNDLSDMGACVGECHLNPRSFCLDSGRGRGSAKPYEFLESDNERC